MHFPLGTKIQGKLASSLYPLLVWWLGFLVFIQATQVQVLGRELRSHLAPLLSAAPLRSMIDLGLDLAGRNELEGSITQLLLRCEGSTPSHPQEDEQGGK